MPDGVRAVVHRRLITLDTDTRRALEVGAVCGVSFDGRTVSTVLGIDRAGMVDLLAGAVTAGVVREEEPDRYAFVHALVGQTLLDDLTQTAVAHMHCRIAEALEQHPRPGTLAAIAAHYNAGRAVASPERVLHSAHAAGDEAMHRLAFDEADAHFRVALSALDELEPDPDLRYTLLTSLGSALNARAVHDLGDEFWLEAADVARRQGDPARLHAAILGYQYLIRLRPPDELSELVDALVDLVGPQDSAQRATALGIGPWRGSAATWLIRRRVTPSSPTKQWRWPAVSTTRARSPLAGERGSTSRSRAVSTPSRCSATPRRWSHCAPTRRRAPLGDGR